MMIVAPAMARADHRAARRSSTPSCRRASRAAQVHTLRTFTALLIPWSVVRPSGRLPDAASCFAVGRERACSTRWPCRCCSLHLAATALGSAAVRRRRCRRRVLHRAPAASRRSCWSQAPDASRPRRLAARAGRRRASASTRWPAPRFGIGWALGSTLPARPRSGAARRDRRRRSSTLPACGSSPAASSRSC